MNEDNPDKDIQEVFEDLLFFEENIIKEAYKEGFKIGMLQGNIEGFHLGYHRGSEIGAEIGFYLGIIEKYLDYFSKIKEEKSEKVVNSLKNLKTLLVKFPKSNLADVDIFELLNTIRSQFKRICAQMKVNIIYKEIDGDNISF